MDSLIWDNKINTSIEIMKIQRNTISVCMDTILDDVVDFRQNCVHINEMLDQLEQLCQSHFKYEEQLLEELNYPPASKQKYIHNLFLKDIVLLKSNNNQCHTSTVIYNFIKLRFDYINNINSETMMLFDYLNTKFNEDTADTSH